MSGDKKRYGKPCDNRDWWLKLPCLAPGGKVCYGRQYWDCARGLDPKPLRNMRASPWIEDVRAYWRKKGYTA